MAGDATGNGGIWGAVVGGPAHAWVRVIRTRETGNWAGNLAGFGRACGHRSPSQDDGTQGRHPAKFQQTGCGVRTAPCEVSAYGFYCLGQPGRGVGKRSGRAGALRTASGSVRGLDLGRGRSHAPERDRAGDDRQGLGVLVHDFVGQQAVRGRGRKDGLRQS